MAPRLVQRTSSRSTRSFLQSTKGGSHHRLYPIACMCVIAQGMLPINNGPRCNGAWWGAKPAPSISEVRFCCIDVCWFKRKYVSYYKRIHHVYSHNSHLCNNRIHASRYPMFQQYHSDRTLTVSRLHLILHIFNTHLINTRNISTN